MRGGGWQWGRAAKMSSYVYRSLSTSDVFLVDALEEKLENVE